MSLIHWEPLKELNTLRQRMNHLFDEIIHPEQIHDIFSKIENLNWNPAIEIQETEREVIVKAQVPGIDTKDLDIQVSENAVAIAGEYQEEKTSDSKGFYRSEFSYGKFQRVIPLPVTVKNEEVKASAKDGVVVLTLPKADISKQNIVKVNLTVEEKAREAIAEERLHEENLQAKMHERVAEELEQNPSDRIAESARTAMTEQRLHQEHLEENMHSRTSAETGI